MKIQTKELELFKNLSQFDIGNVYYDFHNDFDCIKISLTEKSLVFSFKEIAGNSIISFAFEDVIFVRFDLFNFSEFNNLTIDNIYRGRYEENGSLIEFNEDGRSYFYIEFYQGANIELWCSGIILKNSKTT